MLRRLIPLFAACGLLALGGYQVSFWRAGLDAPVQEALAAAGASGSLLSGGDDDGGYHIWELEVFSDVVLKVNDDYVDPDRIDPREMLRGALQQIEREVAEVLVKEVSPGQLRIEVMGKQKTVYIDDVESLWEINLKLRDIFRFLERHLPPREDLRTIEYAAANGALATLDPHSVLLQPEAFAEMKTSTKGEFGGLGIVISIRDGKLTVMSPLDGTPASRAGLESGDVISRIGDVSTVSMSIEEAVRMLRGPEGSQVTIWVDRESWPDPRRFEITRERIKIESVESELLSDNVGYIKIKNFQQNTGDDLEKELATLEKKAGGRLKGLVLDLRNNPGGLLDQAIQVSDAFVSSGDIVTTVGYGNQLREPKRARWAGTNTDVPVAVLVNQGSASASEIVAGALKNLDRAIVVGERTFGKGSVQVLYDFADSSALKLTIAQYLTPGNISIQNEGVVPDVALRSAIVEKSSVRLYHRPEGHRESSLDKHLDRTGDAAAPYETKAKFTLTHLVDTDDENDEAPDPTEFAEDYRIQFARELLTSIGASRRTTMLQRGKPFIEKRQAEERERIHAAIEELGLDWSEGPVDGVVSARLELKGANGPQHRVRAGSEVELEAFATNESRQAIHRVHGVLRSEHPSFKGRELLFGKIEPGETKSWTVTAKIPTDAVSRSDVVELDLTADDVRLPTSADIAVITRAIPHPQFAYTYTLDDAERGDGDGILEVGEGIDLRVLVTNIGEGAAEDVALHLKSAAGEKLFLERGRTSLGSLEPGKTRAGTLKFRVPEGKSAAGSDLPLEVTIYDGGTGEWVEDQFEVLARSAKAAKVETLEGRVVARERTLLIDRASDQGEVVATWDEGAALPVTARVDERWYRVEIGADAFAFARADAVQRVSAEPEPEPEPEPAETEPAEPRSEPTGEEPDAAGDDDAASEPESPKPGTFAGVTVQPRRRPPIIAFSDRMGGSIVVDDHVELRGVVSGRELRDMYVLVNDEKVFFQTAPGREASPAAVNEAPKSNADSGWTPPDDEAVKMPFSVGLELDEGLNRVLVVARLDEKVVSYRSFFVSRQSPPPAVAERDQHEGKDLERGTR
jgi:carboxyl-terminal processing protease